jgi:hypothetical protein
LRFTLRDLFVGKFGVTNVLEAELKVNMVYLKQLRSHEYCCYGSQLEFVFRLRITLNIAVEKVYDTNYHEEDVTVFHLTHLSAVKNPIY